MEYTRSVSDELVISITCRKCNKGPLLKYELSKDGGHHVLIYNYIRMMCEYTLTNQY